MPNTLLKHPTQDTYIFGYIAEKNSRGVIIPKGPIHLKSGKHNGPNKGFGAAHIWAEHRREMEVRGHTMREHVPAYVAEIVCPGASVFCEFENMSKWQKLAVIRTAIGTAILQYVASKEAHYSVVTAFARKNANGTRIGSVQENCEDGSSVLLAQRDREPP